MNARDELASIIMSPESFDGGPASCGPNDVYAARIAAAILAAGWRPPTPPAHALPEGVHDSFTYLCTDCRRTVTVVRSETQPHACTSAEIREAARAVIDALTGRVKP